MTGKSVYGTTVNGGFAIHTQDVIYSRHPFTDPFPLASLATYSYAQNVFTEALHMTFRP